MPLPPRRFSVDEYHRLLDAQVLRPGARTELLRGVIVERPVRLERAARVVGLLHRRLDQALSGGVVLRRDEPLTLSDDTELAPALSVVSREALSRAVRHPKTATLVVEVLDEALEQVSAEHPAVFAAGDVQELWLVNLVDARVEVHWKPVDGAYQDVMVLDGPATLGSRALPGVQVSAAQLFGRRPRADARGLRGE